MQESLESKKKGDAAFRHMEFQSAIECYTQVTSLFCFDLFFLMGKQGLQFKQPLWQVYL